MKKGLLKFSLLLITWMLVISVSYAAKITQKNGRVIEGEIISFDKSSVTVKELVFGIIEIARERILKIEPPLQEKEVKKERIEPEIQKQEERYIVDFTIREKKLISICLSGGMNNINGGDLNGAIRDYKELIKDLNDYYYGTDHSADWKELSWIQNFKGEVLFNLSPNFSIGLGFEYLTKKNKGTITFSEDNSDTIYENGYYYTYSRIDNYSEEPSYKLVAIPVTLNIYYFMPFSKKVEAFFVGGIGYYFGTLTYDNPYQSDIDYKEDYYSAADDTYLFSWVEDDLDEGTGTYKATCNTIGFHGGMGVDIKLSSNISLVAEGIYRYVKFNDWEGSWSDEWTYDDRWGWSDAVEGYDEASGSASDEWSGKIWYYDEYENSDIGKWYKKMELPDRDPMPLEGKIKNVRQAEINLNGFSLRIGIKFSF